MPGTENEKSNRCSSWKEIAAYLGCNVRTCQRWEKELGLPVFRIGESVRARVYAQKEDLESWLESQSKKANLQQEVQKQGRVERSTPIRGKGYFFLIMLAVCATAILFMFALEIFADHQPNDFRIENSVLVITNSAGKELWRYDTKLKNLFGTEAYKKSFQSKNEYQDERQAHIMLPFLIIKDLDKDGFNEVLFNPRTTDESQDGHVICFDHRGHVLWDHQTGRYIHCGLRNFPSDFSLSGMDTRDLFNDGLQEIIILSHAKNEWPTQVLILSPKDEVLGEYWNAGTFDDIEYIDINHDGYEEICLSGQNNEYEKPCLVVLSSRSAWGGSPQSQAFACDGTKRGNELFYVLFPLTDVDQIHKPGIALYRTERLQNKIIRSWTGVSLISFEFNLNLGLQFVGLSHTYERKRHELFLAGKIIGELDKTKTIFDLAHSVLYYDGKAKRWSNHRAMANTGQGIKRNREG